MNQFLVSSIWQHPLDSVLIGFSNQHVDVQIPFSLIRFLGQNVAGMRMAALDLAAGRQAKELRRAFVCFQFWHNSPC